MRRQMGLNNLRNLIRKVSSAQSYRNIIITLIRAKTSLISLFCSVILTSGIVNAANVYSIQWITPPATAPGLKQQFFHSNAAKQNVSYHIYFPDAYHIQKERRFPVIYWLHGHTGGVEHLPMLVKYFDQAIQNGKLPPVLLVFPNGMAESMWCNSKDGAVPMETVIINELIPHIDQTYRTIQSRHGRLIEGFSMGGYGAARLGIKYSDIFGAVSILGAGPMQLDFTASKGPKEKAPDRVRIMKNVYGNDPAYFRAMSPWMLGEEYADKIRARKSIIRIVIGEQDNIKGPNLDFAAHLTRLRMPHVLRVIPNVGHEPMKLYQAIGGANWRFYTKLFRDANHGTFQKRFN